MRAGITRMGRKEKGSCRLAGGKGDLYVPRVLKKRVPGCKPAGSIRCEEELGHE
jgi:hypothetical protein